MNLSDVLDQLDLPPTRVADTAWDLARRRRARRRGLAAGAVAAVAVAATAAVAVGLGAGRDAVPSPAPASSPTHQAHEPTASVVQWLWFRGHWRSEVSDLESVPGSAAPPRLSADPVPRAALAINDPGDPARVLVLGEDGGWREVDAPGLVAAGNRLYPRPILRPTSLSPDATRLALPQPNALVVVDLTTGTSQRYDVPGRTNLTPVWVDEEHVVLVPEGARHGTLVDLLDGALSPSRVGATTAAVQGTTLTWGAGGPTYSTLVRGDGRRVRTLGDNGGGFFPQPPLVQGDVAVGVGGIYSGDRGLPFGTVGIDVVDTRSGEVLAYLPLTRSNGSAAVLLGWDGDRPLIGIPHAGVVNLDVFAWDWRHGSLDPVGSVGARDVSWGTGRLP